MIKQLLFLCVMFYSIFGVTQCDRVFVSGRVIDSLRPQSFYNLMVINKTVGRGVFGQPNG